jgi:hypothetical protein
VMIPSFTAKHRCAPTMSLPSQVTYTFSRTSAANARGASADAASMVKRTKRDWAAAVPQSSAAIRATTQAALAARLGHLTQFFSRLA